MFATAIGILVAFFTALVVGVVIRFHHDAKCMGSTDRFIVFGLVPVACGVFAGTVCFGFIHALFDPHFWMSVLIGAAIFAVLYGINILSGKLYNLILNFPYKVRIKVKFTLEDEE